jgi:putative membrane protein
MLQLVSSLVKGFTVSGFWTAFFASMIISILSFLIGASLSNGNTTLHAIHHNTWVYI